MPGASEDGSSIYFVSDAVLTTAANPRGEPRRCRDMPQLQPRCPSFPAACCDLYLWRGGQIKLVAVLSGEDRAGLAAFERKPMDPLARVSPNGEWLAFMSDRSLTGL